MIKAKNKTSIEAEIEKCIEPVIGSMAGSDNSTENVQASLEGDSEKTLTEQSPWWVPAFMKRAIGRLKYLFYFQEPNLFEQGEYDHFVFEEKTFSENSKKKIEEYRNMKINVHLYGALEQAARFERLPLSEMQSGNLLIGDTYLSLPSGKRVRVGLAGDRFSQKFLKKVKKTNAAIVQKIPYWKEVRDENVRELLTDLNLEREHGKLLPGERSFFTAMRWLMPVFSGKPRCPQLLDLMSFAEGLCGPHPEELVRTIETGDAKILRRGTKVAALGVHLALLLGYFELDLLKIIWNIFLFLDTPLAFEKFKSRLEVRDAVTDWANQGYFDVSKFSEAERRKLKNHTLRASAFLRIMYRDEFQELWDHQLRVIPVFHHENQRGRGPLGVESGRLMELERLAAYADKLADSSGGNWFKNLRSLSKNNWGGLCPVLGERLLSVFGNVHFLEIPEDENREKEVVYNEQKSEVVDFETGEKMIQQGGEVAS